MCKVHVFHCRSCDTLSPIPVISEGENQPAYRPLYVLVDDEPCRWRWECARQRLVFKAYAPSAEERRRLGEGPCARSHNPMQFNFQENSPCSLDDCCLVRVERDCARHGSKQRAVRKDHFPHREMARQRLPDFL